MGISIIVGSLLKIYCIIISLNSDTFYAKHKALISFVIFYFAIILARSYVNNKIKAFFDLKYISQRILLISYGFTGFIIFFFTGIFTSCVSCSKDLINYVCKMEYDGKFYYDEIHNYFESGKNTLVRLIVIFLSMIAFFFNKYYSTLIIELYTPIHVTSSFPIQFFIQKGFLLIFTAIFFRDDLFPKERQSLRFLLDISGDTFSIIGFLIYLEIIELHFCNLDFNLRKNIMVRSKNEVEDIFIAKTGEKLIVLENINDDELSI